MKQFSHEARCAMVAIVVGMAVLPTMVSAQNAVERRHAQAIRVIQERAAEVTANALADIQSLDDWKQARPRIRKEFLYNLGLDPMPERTPLQVEVTGTVEEAKYRVEKVVFQSSPGLYVTGNLYLPQRPGDGAAEKYATILYVCGHSPHPQGAKWNYQDRAIWFVEHGFVCFVLDTLEFGEVPGVHHGLHNLNRWHWLSRGYTPAGVEVWNAIRAIDYLESRSEVDPARIGITGISGGGAISWYAAAADERIAVSVPVCGTIAFGSQAKHWRAHGQCDCIYFHNTFLADQSVVGALIAPRPLLICSGQRDPDFPPDGYHDAYQRIKRIHDFYAGTPAGSDRIREVEEDVGHTDSPLFRQEARQWMYRWLREQDRKVDIEPNPTDRHFAPETLACLPGLPRDAINDSIDESFIPLAKPTVPGTLDAWSQRRSGMLSELREKTFRWFPSRETPLKANARRGGSWASRYADCQDIELETEPGVSVHVQLLRVPDRTTPRPLVIYAKRPGDSIYHADFDELLPILGRCDVAILNPRLTEKSIPAADYADIERSSAWIGRTIAAMQVWDILRTVDWLLTQQQFSPQRVSLYGKGDMAVNCVYAALLEERIDQVVARDPTSTHRIGPALLNVLRITDIPEAAAMLAPRQLTFIGDQFPHAFSLTRDIYDLHGEAEQMKNVRSLAQALEAWKY